MNIFALIALCSFVICIFVAAFVYLRNPKALSNKLFMFLSIILAGFTLLQFGYSSSHSYDEACFWWRLDFFWPLIPTLLLHFVLAFTGKKRILKRKSIYAAIYGPAIVILVLDMTLHMFTGPPIRQNWGWTFSAPDNLANGLVYVWYQGLMLLSIVIGFREIRVSNSIQRRNQIKLLCLALLIGVGGSIIELMLVFLSVPSPPFVVICFVIGNCFIGYAIWKYELFALTPITAAEHIITTMTDSLLLVSPEGKVLSTNTAAEQLFGYGEKEFAQLPIEDIFSEDAEKPLWLTTSDPRQRISVNRIKYIDTSFHTKDNKDVPVSLALSALHDDNQNLMGFVLIGRDISDRQRASEKLEKYQNHLEEIVEQRTKELKQETFERLKIEEDRAHLEEQLYHSQKMEAIGRLAGGVAHDFNNLLFVITGYSEAFLNAIAPHDPMREDAEEIHKASRRAAGLTQQLLAFSRRQVISPKVINLIETFSSVENMLGRIIGEDIDLVFAPDRKVGRIMMDPVQVDQVLANLFVNARDAMPSGGKLTVTAKNVEFDDECHDRNPEAEPGRYVLVSVNDTGCGIDEKTRAKIFEPFFTTKGRGKGTGLGLSTVYGIVKQNRGFIEVESEPGVGTTFNIYLPKSVTDSDTKELQDTAIAPTGSETILLVEDEIMVRRLASQLLQRQGYNVLEAVDATEALTIFQRYNGNVDLLFTDIVMPGMSGKQLSENLIRTKPELRVLYMSGHNDELIDQHGCLNSDAPLLQKPFTSADLSWKVREVLDA
ncbi:MAG: response regulator [Proteobacteria bacterium]|nr:response regulator [Pseudomonadota bacterium]